VKQIGIEILNFKIRDFLVEKSIFELNFYSKN